MNLLREIPPTAGLPIYPRDLIAAFFNRNRPGSLEEDLKNYLSASYAAVTYSGTAAFYIILEALKSLSPKRTVIIPSFICPLVPLAIKRAGLKVLVCDINKNSFDFEIDQLKELCLGKDILAVVPVHLAGIPADLETIQQIARELKIFVIEDCAQSLGAMYKDRLVGTFGDFAFFSLCRGKGLTIYEGGVIVSKPEFAAAIDAATSRIVKKAPLSEFLKIIELFGYWIFYRPLLFWFVFRLPQVFWEIQGKMEKAFIEYFTVDFPVHKVSKIRKDAGRSMYLRLEENIVAQRKNAFDYIAGLKGVGGLTLITEAAGNRSNYPYLTLVFDERSKRDKAWQLFKNSGLGVSQIYLCAITDYDYLKDIVGTQSFPNAAFIAKHHITLSTSAFLSHKDISRVIEKIKNL